MTNPTVTIATAEGQQQTDLLLACTGSPLAITAAVDDDGGPSDEWVVITHLPTGRTIPGAIAHRSEIGGLTQLIEKLADLPWDVSAIIADWRGLP
jgi:hypothetical protein